MFTRWTQHLKDPKEQEVFARDVLSARSVLERLHQLVEEDEKALSKKEINPSSYNTPSWSHLQAHNNGLRQYMCQIKTLINLDQQKEPTSNDHRESISQNR